MIIDPRRDSSRSLVSAALVAAAPGLVNFARPLGTSVPELIALRRVCRQFVEAAVQEGENKIWGERGLVESELVDSGRLRRLSRRGREVLAAIFYAGTGANTVLGDCLLVVLTVLSDYPSRMPSDDQLSLERMRVVVGQRGLDAESPFREVSLDEDETWSRVYSPIRLGFEEDSSLSDYWNGIHDSVIAFLLFHDHADLFEQCMPVILSSATGATGEVAQGLVLPLDLMATWVRGCDEWFLVC